VRGQRLRSGKEELRTVQRLQGKSEQRKLRRKRRRKARAVKIGIIRR
jgi:hypothetical protein